jgi:hypothetical protein
MLSNMGMTGFCDLVDSLIGRIWGPRVEGTFHLLIHSDD